MDEAYKYSKFKHIMYEFSKKIPYAGKSRIL